MVERADMNLTVETDRGEIFVRVERKQVKNINLRVTKEGHVKVSVHPNVPLGYIADFVRRQEDFIERAKKRWEAKRIHLETIEKQVKSKAYRENALCLCKEVNERVYALFLHHGYIVPKADIKLRSMTSRWGSCQPRTGCITINLQLVGGPIEFLEYVLIHEYAHFIEANHSRNFHAVVEKVLPHWKEVKEQMQSYFYAT